MFYVYAHYKPNTRIPFYIGKGKGERAYKKINRNKHWHNTVNKYGYRVEILYDNLDEFTAFDLECHLIACYGRADLGEGPLVNLSDGGDGTSGYVVSEKTKQKQRLKRLGQHLTDSTKQKMSNTLRGSGSYWFGKSRSEKTRKKISQSLLGNSLSIESRQKISSKLIGRRLSNTTKAKMSKPKSLEHRKNMVLAWIKRRQRNRV